MDPESRAALRVSKDIEREIERCKRDNSKEYKLLLLGKWTRPALTTIQDLYLGL